MTVRLSAGYICPADEQTTVEEVEGAVKWEHLTEAEGSESPAVIRNTRSTSSESAELCDVSLRFLEEWTRTTATSSVGSAGVRVIA